MKQLAIAGLLLVGTMILGSAQAGNSPAEIAKQKLVDSRDSLTTVLNATSDPKMRVGLLTDLADVELTLSNDYTAVERLWDEALRAHDTEAVIGAGKSLTMRYINRGALDSADLWIARCKEHFEGSCAEPAMSYLEMMREIRDMKDVPKVADKLIARSIRLRESNQPYQSMKTLFQLGIISSYESFTNLKLENARTSEEYMKEGLAIARTLPLKEAYSFHLQFLVALGGVEPQYAEEIITLRDRYLALTPDQPRPYRSRRPEIMAYARLINNGTAIGREKLDESFRRFKDLTARYPYDSPTPLDFYFPKVALQYYLAVNDYHNAVACCDSAMVNAPKYKMGGWQFYEPRMESLVALGNYRRAYDDARAYLHIKDSLNANNATEQLMELQTQYDVDRLEFDNKIKRWQLSGVLSTCAALLILLGFLIRYTYLLRRKNRSLYEQIRESVRSFKELQQIKQETTIRAEALPLETTLFERFENLVSDSEIYSDTAFNRDRAAALLNTNTTYLAQAIQETQGQGFNEYMTLLRMRHAARIMQEEPDISLDEISIRVGYGSYSGFYSAFRKQFNLSPRKYLDFLKEQPKQH